MCVCGVFVCVCVSGWVVCGWVFMCVCECVLDVGMGGYGVFTEITIHLAYQSIVINSVN